MSDRGYPIELRERAVAAYEAKEGSLKTIAARFMISIGVLQNWRKLKKETGSLEPRPHGGGVTPELDERADNLLRSWTTEQSDLLLRELVERLKKEGYDAYDMMVSRALSRLGISRKKSRSTRRNVSALTSRKQGRGGRAG